jgi:perosamine synthetase
MKVPWADPWLGRAEKRALMKVFDSTWLSMGSKTEELEERLKRYTGAGHAVAVSNGSIALDLALKVLGVGPGDEVIAPAITYVATINAILWQYAIPVFADIELDTYNISPCSAQKLISPRTKCIVYIDYGGNPADYAGLKRISDKHKIPLLHDGAQSLGGRLNGEMLCRQGAICTTSFHIAKLITTVEGGMIFSGNRRIADKLRMMRNQGEDPRGKYRHLVLGTNARMTDLQAAIGIEQIKKIGVILKKREAIANSYCRAFKNNRKIKLPLVRQGGRNSWFFAPILVEGRDRVLRKLNKRGISTRIAYPVPVYDQPFFRAYRDKNQRYSCPNAEWMARRVINLPIFHHMKKNELAYVVDNVLKAV